MEVRRAHKAAKDSYKGIALNKVQGGTSGRSNVRHVLFKTYSFQAKLSTQNLTLSILVFIHSACISKDLGMTRVTGEPQRRQIINKQTSKGITCLYHVSIMKESKGG